MTSLRRFDVKVYKKNKNAQNLKNVVERRQNIDKNIATRKEVWHEAIACRIP